MTKERSEAEFFRMLILTFEIVLVNVLSEEEGLKHSVPFLVSMNIVAFSQLFRNEKPLEAIEMIDKSLLIRLHCAH